MLDRHTLITGEVSPQRQLRLNVVQVSELLNLHKCQVIVFRYLLCYMWPMLFPAGQKALNIFREKLVPRKDATTLAAAACAERKVLFLPIGRVKVFLAIPSEECRSRQLLVVSSG